MTNEQKYLNVAIKAAKESGIIFKKFFGHATGIAIKNNDKRNPVTELDKKIEKHIRQSVSKNFPSHKIIGEEYSKDKVNKDDVVWIIDPIDGTSNYIHGIPYCCISIGIWQNNQPVAAVVYNPILKQLFTAQKNKGAFLNGQKLFVSKCSLAENAFGSYGWGHDIAKVSKDIVSILPMLNKIRAFGSTAFELCMVATGQFDFKLQGITEIWDIAAASLIVTEAGGQVTDWEGNSLSPSTKKVLASNTKVHKQILSKIKKSVQI